MNMDRFRHRVWIVEKQEMRYLTDGFDLSSTYVSPELKPVLEIPPDVDNDRYIIGEECFLMQCTGLKDSEGKLVHEGDVLADEEKALYIVQWESGMFSAKWIGARISIPLRSALPEVGEQILCKVLGNIHEHPSLLEVEK